MMFFESGLYLRVEELPDGPKPLPLDSGFSAVHAYRARGLYNPSATSSSGGFATLASFENPPEAVAWCVTQQALERVAPLVGYAACRVP